MAFWGKTGTGESWHSAVHHMIDVGAVAELLVADRLGTAFQSFIAAALGIGQSRAALWAGFLVSLHDIGKISPGFQNKVPERFPPEFQVEPHALSDHGRVSVFALAEILQAAFGESGRAHARKET